MPFGIICRMGPGMRHVLGFGDRSTERGTLGANFGGALSQRRGPLPKLLWADLLLLFIYLFIYFHGYSLGGTSILYVAMSY